jgi:hypothetical protein
MLIEIVSISIKPKNSIEYMILNDGNGSKNSLKK